MNAPSVVKELADAGIRLSLDGEQLKVKAPKGSMTEGLRQRLADNKSELIQWLKSSRADDKLAREIPYQSRDRDHHPISLMQNGIWFISQWDPSSTAYNITSGVELRGQLDVGAMEASFNTLIQRHEALRTRFESRDGEPVQILEPEVMMNLRVDDFSDLPIDQSESAAKERADELVSAPFDLSQAPLIRARLFRLSEERFWLLICMHHIVADEWSCEILLNELAECYQAHSQGGAPDLAELPIQYVDYAHWQQNEQSEILEKELAFWEQTLSDVPPVLDLPTDYPRPPRQSNQGGGEVITIPASVGSALKALADEAGATTYMAVLAVFEAFLYRYTGASRFAVGTPVANRPHAQLARVFGMFVNTLALRASVDGAKGYRALLEQVRSHCLEAFDNASAPFQQVVDHLNVPRSPSYAPLFQVMFVMEQSGDDNFSLGDLELAPLSVGEELVKNDLAVAVHGPDAEGELSVSMTYRQDLFSHTTIQRLIGNFRHLLESAVADPDCAIDELPLIGEAEAGLHEQWRHSRWTGNETFKPILSRVDEWVASQPDAEAVRDGDAVISYDDLARRSDELAARLRAAGIGTEDMVGLYVARSIDMVVGVLGIMKAGAAYVPLDPGYPEDRLRYMLDDSGIQWVVSHQPLASRSLKANTLWMDSAADRDIVQVELPAIRPTQAAYVIYTSGSTGRPKGVVVNHGGLSNVIEAYAGNINLAPRDRVMHFCSLSFDAATAHLFLALTSGACLCIYDKDDEKALPLEQALAEQAINYVGLPVSVLSSLSPNRLPALKTVSTGTEACPEDLLTEWGAQRRFVNVYGPTETTVSSTMAVYDDGRDAYGQPSIGRPIANTNAYVLDDHLRPVPVGVTGELYLGGIGLARGYLGKPGMTAERFLPDPLSSVPGARMYRTGDLVRHRNNGDLEFVGRVDKQVKLRGYRIELTEIEAVLRQYDGVKDAAVEVWENDAGIPCLVAYLVGEGAAMDDRDGLRAHLRQCLPDFMVPAHFIDLAELPLSENGKLDRKALPAPRVAELGKTAYEPPRTETECHLAAILETLLKVENVGRHDDFFDLGGNSLIAMQLVARIREQLDVGVGIQALFECPEVAELGARIDALCEAANDSSLPVLRPTPKDRPAPLSYAQQRLWFLEELGGVGMLFHVCGALRLTGPLDVEAMRASFEYLVDRHAAFRTSFVSRDGQPEQIVHGDVDFQVPVEHVARDKVEERARELLQEPFDLTRAPMFRVHLLALSETEHVLVMAMHHIISDGWSLKIITDELTRAYRDFSSGRSPDLPELEVDYADYARWERAWLDAGELERQMGYWREQLDELPAQFNLPTDKPRPTVQSRRADACSVTVPAEVRDTLHALGRRTGASLFMVSLAAFQAFLSRISGERDVFVGTTAANRGRRELESVVGFFINNLVLRNQVSAGESFEAFLSRVRESTVAAYAHQDVPFDRLVEELAPVRSLGHAPLFQIMFNYLEAGAEQEALSFGNLTLSELDAVPTQAEFDLDITVRDEGEAMHIDFIYCSDLFEAETIEDWLAYFKNLLVDIAQSPQKPVGRLQLASEQTVERYHRLCAGPAFDPPPSFDVLSLVADLAQSRPDQVAYEKAGETLSYGELASRSNALAARLSHHTRDRVEPVIGVNVSRGIDLPIAILATWKAGGVYLPLDPAYPRERLVHICEDAHTVALLCDSQTRQGSEGLCSDTPVIDLSESDALATREAPPAVTIQADALAYVIYTSGSTGRPKGVQVSHRAMMEHSFGALSAYGLSDRDRVLHFAALGFDISLDQLIPPLIAGATIVARDEEVWEPVEFARNIEALDLTVIDVPTALWHVLAKTWRTEKRLPANPQLRLVLVGGEAMTVESIVDWAAGPYASVRVLNGYGPTETTITSSAYELTGKADFTGAVPVGTPFARRRMYVLDEGLRRLPPGVPGELFIAGEGVSRGYRGLPAQTAAGFLPDPWSWQPGGRMYRTGDRVRYRRDGTIEFMGRLDDQVKVRGVRVELSEVETALRSLHGVRDAAAALKRVRGNQADLVGYVIPERGAEMDTAALRGHLREFLPEAFVPSWVVAMESFPTHNDKIQRGRLPLPDVDDDDRAEFLPPRGPVEEWLCECWSALLGIERVGINDHFFELGGHSLLATQLLARINRQWHTRLTVRQLFESPTLAALADLIAVIVEARDLSEVSEPETDDAQRDEFEV